MSGKTETPMNEIYMRRAENLKMFNKECVELGFDPIPFYKMKSLFHGKSKLDFKEVFDDE